MEMKFALYRYCSNSLQEILLYRLPVLRVRGSTMWLLRLENIWRANGLLYCCYEVFLLYFRSGGPAVFWSRWLHPQRLKAEIVMFAAVILRYQT
jgi:hypothetical protein